MTNTTNTTTEAALMAAYRAARDADVAAHAAVHYTREGETVTMHVPLAMLCTDSAQTARNDARVTVPAGDYAMRSTLIGGQPCSIEDAYYFAVDFGKCVLANGGYPDETVGVTTRNYGLRTYGYIIRKALAD